MCLSICMAIGKRDTSSFEATYNPIRDRLLGLLGVLFDQLFNMHLNLPSLLIGQKTIGTRSFQADLPLREQTVA